jgi:hypothetical protein
MGRLDEPGLDALIAAGCGACGAKRLVFQAYLDGLLPLIGGDPCGAVKWVYDGEKFVDGVYRVSCEACKEELLSAAMCPRCHSEGTLAGALAAKNAWPVPATCPSCDDDQVRYIAFIPAKVVYEGGRAEKPRTSVGLFDAGFHGYRVDCRDCGKVAERCPLCAAPAPLRVRPG